MSGFQKRKVQDLQKPFPGCMGRMINLLDLNAGMAGAKLITDEAHRDGSPVCRNQSDVKKAMDPTRVYVDDKQIASDLRKSSSSKRSGGTPVKMLMAQEMSKETEMKRKPPGVVARLMGLDDGLPAQKHVLVANKRNSQDSCSSNTSTGSFQGCRLQEYDYFNKPMPCESADGKMEYKDVYKVWQRPSRTSRIKDQHQQKGRCNKDQNEKRIALVRQKFMEAKRLAIDEKLLQSKEFQDALDVLSSNKDLFIKFLEEPNSLFSKKIRELYTVPPAPQTKHITILKPSKTVETKGEKLVKRQQFPTVDEGRQETINPYWSNSFTNSKTESLSPPTRIVVLKPSPGKHRDMKMKVNPRITSPELLQRNDVYESLGDNEAIGSREEAKEITRQMRESLSCHRRDESLLSSVHSNGYAGDESSFYKSENEYMDGCGSISDSEIMTPTSQHSWDYINRFGSPYLASSFGRASCSPESSVIREAKIRLSERLALMASKEAGQEQIQMPGSLSTLGEILAIPGVKKEEAGDGGLTVTNSRSCGEDELRAQAVCLSIGWTKVEDGQFSPKTLSRSKSVPVSSSVYENIGLSVKTSDSEIHEPTVAKVVGKSKNGKSTFRAKFSSLFFSKSKKASREKPVLPPSVGSDDIFQSGDAETIIDKNDDLPKSAHNSSLMESPLVNLVEKPACSASAMSASNGSKEGSSKATLSLDEPRTYDNLDENQDKFRSSKNSGTNRDQPSPTSVLDAPFEDDANDDVLQTSNSANAGQQQAVCRSSAIELVARPLSWDDIYQETSSPNPSKLYRALPKGDAEGQEKLMFVQKLLSFAGLDGQKSGMVFSRWYSVDSPLNPILLDKFLDQKEEEAKSRERRSNQRLLFDCVNAALLEIGQATLLNAYPWKGPYHHLQKDASPGTQCVGKVWGHVSNWFSGETKLLTGDDNSILVVDKVLRREVEGRGWAESMKLEIDELSTEIGGEIFEDLVREALLVFAGTSL